MTLKWIWRLVNQRNLSKVSISTERVLRGQMVAKAAVAVAVIEKLHNQNK